MCNQSAFTTDIWSCDVTPLSLLSLTAHWVDTLTPSSFTLQSAVLQANEFRGSHTGKSIAESIEGMLVKWNISKSCVHVILRDNASNMKKAMDEMGVSSLGCFAHSLQLVVHEGLLSQRSVSDALANCRKIIGHFKTSPLATTRLEDIQRDLKMPTKRLHQDVATRWNSTFYMVESLLEQKRPISAYGADHDCQANIDSQPVGFAGKNCYCFWHHLRNWPNRLAPQPHICSGSHPLSYSLKRLLARERPMRTRY